MESLKKLMEETNYDLSIADSLCTELRRNNKDNLELLELQRVIHDKITVNSMPGPSYLEWLTRFHECLLPSTYVEIGVESGKSLQFAKFPTKAIGIDPEPHIVYGTQTWSRIFKSTSDDFFKNQDLKLILQDYVKLSFIDGLHYFEQALKDFINIEKSSTKDTVVLLHDVLPAVAETAKREWTTFYWAGDTWKIMPILQLYRPDLFIKTIPTYPTGLGYVTNLDPHSTILTDSFDHIVEKYMNKSFEDLIPVNLINNDFKIFNM
jgi:hypothetical protein